MPGDSLQRDDMTDELNTSDVSGHHLPKADDLSSLLLFHRIFYDQVAAEYDRRALNEHVQLNARRIERTASVLGKTGRVLEVGCGVGLAAGMIEERGYEVVGVDVSPVMLDFARTRAPSAEFICADIMTLSSRELGTFDWVSAQGFLHIFPRARVSEVLYHLMDFVAPGGVLSVSTTFSEVTTEGWKRKVKYPGRPVRYRTEWSLQDFLGDVATSSVRIVDTLIYREPDNTQWVSITLMRASGKGVSGE